MKCSYDCYEWIRASASMPVAAKIVEINGMKLLDGGISDSIPLQYFQSIGYEKNIVITTQPEGYQKTENRLLPLIRRTMRKYPRFIKAVEERHLMYNEQLIYLKQKEEEGKTLVIRPAGKLEIGHVSHSRKKMWETYNIGRKAAEDRLEEILSFLTEQ